jgi:hypothetical protein
MSEYTKEGCLGEIGENAEAQKVVSEFLVVAENETAEFCE